MSEAEAVPPLEATDAAAAVKRAKLSNSASSPELASLASLLLHENTGTAGGADDGAAPSSAAPSQPGSVSSLYSFVLSELLLVDSSGSTSRPSSSPRALVYNFLILPYFLERLLGTGSAVCADCFLYLFTVLPFRICAMLVRSLTWPLRPRSTLSSSSSSSSPPLADVLRFVLLLLSWYCLSLLPMSRLYHYIRGQSVLKLYVLFNMLQISDRLFASIGEDILDALFSSTHLPLPYLTFHLAISALYTTLHALLLFAQVITLNVSVNSDNSSLFILLVSNNFVELKSAVFKRFDANNLFQIACSDVVERCQLVLFLILITLMNVAHLGLEVAWEAGWLQKAAVMSVMVVGGEMVVDWIKHGFICKFNMISPRVYRQYAEIIQHDFVQAHFAQTAVGSSPLVSTSAFASTSTSTYSSSTTSGRSGSAHSVSRRLGLSSLPLAVLVLRVVGSTFQQSNGTAPSVVFAWLPFELSVELALKAAVLLLLFAVLTLLKLLISVTLLGRIATQALRDKQQASRATEEREAADSAMEWQKGGSEQKLATAAAGAQCTGKEQNKGWVKEERKEEEETADSALKVEAVKSEQEELKERVVRSGVHRDGLKIITQQHQQQQQPSSPALEVVLQPPDSLVSFPTPSYSHTPFPAALPSSHSHLLLDTADSSLSSSPCASPSSSSSLCLPTPHDGDLVPSHDRVGSVDLLAPSPELFDQLTSIDRYQMTSKTNIPT